MKYIEQIKTTMKTIMDKETTDFLDSLSFRWECEKEYEDFKDYISIMEKTILPKCPVGTKFVKGSKRPFGCTLDIPEFPHNVQISVNAKSIGYKLVRR